MKKAEDAVLDVAKYKFNKFGFKKTTVDEIARETRISKRTIYGKFKSKEDLFVSLFMREALTARKHLLKTLAGIEDPLEKIKAYFMFTQEYFQKHPFMLKVLQDNEGLYAPFLRKKYIANVETGILDIISGILKEGMKKKEFRPLNPLIIAYIIFKLFQAFTYAKTIPLTDRENDAQEGITELLEFITEGIKNK